MKAEPDRVPFKTAKDTIPEGDYVILRAYEHQSKAGKTVPTLHLKHIDSTTEFLFSLWGLKKDQVTKAYGDETEKWIGKKIYLKKLNDSAVLATPSLEVEQVRFP